MAGDSGPGHVLFDSWYSSLENLKKVRSYGWTWLTQFKANRRVNPDGAGNVRVDAVEIGAEGRMVHLRGYGLVKVFRRDSPNGDVEHWATNDPDMTPEGAGGAEGLGLEYRAVSPGAEAVRSHIGMAIQAFLRLEVHRLRSGVSWYEAVASIARPAIRQYLAQPLYSLIPTA